MSKSVEEYHKEFDALYGDHEPTLFLSKVELAASEAAYAWQSDKDGNLTLEMFPDVFKRGFLKGYEQAEKDFGLTIKDLELLHTFLYAVKNNKNGVFTFTRLSDEQYKEVIRRFKAIKEGK